MVAWVPAALREPTEREAPKSAAFVIELRVDVKSTEAAGLDEFPRPRPVMTMEPASAVTLAVEAVITGLVL